MKTKHYRIRFGHQAEANKMLRYIDLTEDEAEALTKALNSLFDYIERPAIYDEADSCEDEEVVERVTPEVVKLLGDIGKLKELKTPRL